MPENKTLLDVHLLEYERLKSEQTQRIGFRDNMIYVHLLAVGGVVSFALSQPNRLYALLIIPWVCFVLGWTYITNDAKISAIASYFTSNLADRIRTEIGVSPNAPTFEWETKYKEDPQRTQRKKLQLFVDEVTFCVSGLIALCVYWFSLLKTGTGWYVYVSLGFLSAFELLLLLIIGRHIYKYADYTEGGENEKLQVSTGELVNTDVIHHTPGITAKEAPGLIKN